MVSSNLSGPVDRDCYGLFLIEIEFLDYSDYLSDGLQCDRIHDYADLGILVNKTPDDMMKVRNLGRKSLEEVLAKLEELGLQLRKGEMTEELN